MCDIARLPQRRFASLQVEPHYTALGGKFWCGVGASLSLSLAPSSDGE